MEDFLFLSFRPSLESPLEVTGMALHADARSRADLALAIGDLAQES